MWCTRRSWRSADVLPCVVQSRKLFGTLPAFWFPYEPMELATSKRLRSLMIIAIRFYFIDSNWKMLHVCISGNFFYLAKPSWHAIYLGCVKPYRMTWRAVSLAVCLLPSDSLNLSDDCKPRLKTKACIRFHPALLCPFHCRHCWPAISAAASDSTSFKWQRWLRRELVWPNAIPFSGFPSSLSPPWYNVLYCFLFIASLLSLHRCCWRSTSLFLCCFLLDHFQARAKCEQQRESDVTRSGILITGFLTELRLWKSMLCVCHGL